MKKTRMAVVLLAGCMLLAGSAWAVDYSKMSTPQLSQMRGQMYNASQADWNAFHQEWWKRMGQMSPEERAQYMGPGMRGGGYGMGYGRGRGRWCGPCPYWDGNGAPPANNAPAPKPLPKAP